MNEFKKCPYCENQSANHSQLGWNCNYCGAIEKKLMETNIDGNNIQKS